MGHECDDGPVEVLVGGERIPLINDGLRTEIRKDGAMDITRHSECYFPVEWHPTDDDPDNYREVVQALDPNAANVYDPVDISIRDEITGELRLVHRGFVMGVGGGSAGNLERRMTVGDVGQMLGAIPFSRSYDADATLGDIIDDVLDELRDRIVGQGDNGVFEEILFDPGSAPLDQRADGGNGRDRGPEANAVPKITTPLGDVNIGTLDSVDVETFIEDAIGLNLEFVGNKHDASDALKVVSDRLANNFRLMFRAGDVDNVRSIELAIIDVNDFVAGHRADHLEGYADTQVLVNNALHEIRPINQQKVKGKSETVVEDKSYPVAIVQAPRLRKRAGQDFGKYDGPVEATTIDGAVEIAKSKLSDRLSESGLGTIVTSPNPTILPFHTLESRIACGAETENSDVDPFTYEIESIVHDISATSDNGERKHETQLQASLPSLEIEVVDTFTENVDDSSNLARVQNTVSELKEEVVDEPFSELSDSVSDGIDQIDESVPDVPDEPTAEERRENREAVADAADDFSDEVTELLDKLRDDGDNE